MTLSVPIYRLKRRAKLLSREKNIPLNEALNRLAQGEGFKNWSLLAARGSFTSPSRKLYAEFAPGDLALLGARPGHGKTMLGIELIIEAVKSGGQGIFFTFEYNENDFASQFPTIGREITNCGERFQCDCSDDISADYIIDRLTSAPRGTVAVIDYLQLLDQKRGNPELSVQVRALKTFASEKGLIIVFISQIHRTYDPSVKACPDISDLRLPNPIDITLFDKTCFLNDGLVQIG